jgi:hypothetical protein
MTDARPVPFRRHYAYFALALHCSGPVLTALAESWPGPRCCGARMFKCFFEGESKYTRNCYEHYDEWPMYEDQTDDVWGEFA